MPARTLAIVNPASRNGTTARRWPKVEKRLRDALGSLEVEFTRAPHHAESIAREGVRAGAECVVVAGGDGTTSEVVEGLLSADLGGYASIAPLPLGSGGDLVRLLGIPTDLDAAIERIALGKTRPIDAGVVQYRAPDGSEARTHFLNIASLGISGLTSQLVNEAPKVLGGRVSFLIGTVRSIIRFRCAPVRLRLDGRSIHEGGLVLATAANGRYFGGGMEVAPNARPDDGSLDVVIIPEIGKPELLVRLASLYRGTHVNVPKVGTHRGRRLEADAEPGTVWIEVDGESVGTLPAVFEVLPGAIRILGWEP